MNPLESLLSAGDGGVLKQLAGQFGLTGDQVGSVVSTVMPALAGGLKEKLAAGGSGADALTGLLSGGSLTSFLDNPGSLSSPAAVDTGRNMLTQIFGGGDLGSLTSMISEKTGIGADTIGRILPVAATVLGSFLAKNTSGGQGDLASILGGLTGDASGLLGAVKSMAAKIFG